VVQRQHSQKTVFGVKPVPEGSIVFLNRPVMIVSGARVPQARHNGALLEATPLELSTLVARHAVSRSGIDPQDFHAVHWGMMYQTEGNSVHLARQTAMGAGLPDVVPAMLANRLCGSGLEAVVQAARAICLEEISAALVGSVDCVSRASAINLEFKKKLPGLPADQDPVTASTLDEHSNKRMAELAECFARRSGIERGLMDSFAFESRRRAAAAQEQGLFKPEIVPVTLESPATPLPLRQDQIESRWPTLESLARLQSPYGVDGRITRGNSSAFADGAAALALAGPLGSGGSPRNELAVIRSWAITAAGACQAGEALVAAIHQALCRAELTAGQIDCFELEEAFAANCVYAIQTLKLPAEKVNPHGGALALGHPPATSGLRHLLHAVEGLRRNNWRFALIGLCAGASQGMAMVIENPA
jgi:acetyl-CoA acetyltransferase family protein